MKKYGREILVLILQAAVFYLFPLFAGPTDAMGMVFLMLVMTLILSVVIGGISKHPVKYAYPAVIAILFIPSVFLYYNKSALVHALWYLVISLVGVLIGALLRKLTVKKQM